LIATTLIAAENNDVSPFRTRRHNAPIANDPIEPDPAVGNKTDSACGMLMSDPNRPRQELAALGA
jgi:hypothetical protein